MSAHRRFMVLACSAALLSWWGTAWLWPQAWADWPRWPLQALAWVGLSTSVMGSQPEHRRLQFTLALLLLLSTWVLPSLQGAPGSRPMTWPSLGHLSSSLHWSALVLGMPFCMGTMITNMQHPVLPAWGRAASRLGLSAWLITMASFVGTWLTGTIPDAPILFWGLLVLLLPFYFKSEHVWLAMPAWLVSLLGLVVSLMKLVVPPPMLRDITLCASASLTGLSWLAWYMRMEDVSRFDAVLAGLRAVVAQPPDADQAHPKGMHVYPRVASPEVFDLDEHLDSPQAQEGADKYTRE
jgi:hypothetical protein